ncbi:hypothetical protein K458DRAFT_403684 [Lentithecium fluviatile CBS 122367]|uniref:RRM domain-containing protein n=1 Tax=Lentithecium fluviatile CBS 122367 TaxID=1168545 RepID=A0A6G1J2R6_9PLEO|nr:hypothetical protein K458DRAFT_403684 [Lentithecium fluviatile CBS 122367]
MATARSLYILLLPRRSCPCRDLSLSPLSSKRISDSDFPVLILLKARILESASKRRDQEIRTRASRLPTPIPSTTGLKLVSAHARSSSPRRGAMSDVGIISAAVQRSGEASENERQGRSMGDSWAGEDRNMPSPTQASLRGREDYELDDPKSMLALFGIDPDSAAAQSEEDGDLDSLYAKMTNMLSKHNEPSDKPETKLDQEVTPCAIALQLERAGTEWNMVQEWTEYLFSEGPNGHKEVTEKTRLIEKAVTDLDAVIEQTLKDEIVYRAAEEQAAVPCRLIVTNLAADADEDEIAYLFREFKYDIRNVRLLDERDPVKGTRTAHVDMFTRTAARHASHTIGDIYGLRVHVRLAQEVHVSDPISFADIDVSN